MEEISKYSHSPVHSAVLRRDHTQLRKIVSSLPRLPKSGEVTTEAESIAGEATADAVSAVIDRRDVPNRETPLHLAVKMRDPIAAEILMSAGADWSLQNAEGWSALQEAVCAREDAVAAVIARHYQPLAWAKWCRRLPRILANIARIRDFYMEISFHFESSVIPFVSRIAPSDTYRIWKRGSSLRADMTLAGFDGFRIQRSDQTFLFLGEGSATPAGRQLPPGSLIVLSHKEKEITDALEGAGAHPSDAEVAHEVALMSKTNMYRPGIDVTQAELVPHLNWRRIERSEMVGNFRAKVYDMLNVSVTVKSRRVPGAISDEELFNLENEERLGLGLGQNGTDLDAGLDEVLTPEEKRQLDSALKMGDYNENNNGENNNNVENNNNNVDNNNNNNDNNNKEKKGWFGWSSGGNNNKKTTPNKSSGGNSVNTKEDKGSSGKKKKGTGSSSPSESEYKKGVRPVLFLTPDFPLKTEELIPLLDVLADKVKAVRRLRELLTTKLPPGMFPVKLAIPIVPTIRVLVTFTKFEELQPLDEFTTPPSSPTQLSKELDASSSWYSFLKSDNNNNNNNNNNNSFKDDSDPFVIPSDYTWVDSIEKKRRLKAKRKSKKGNNSSGKKSGGSKSSNNNNNNEGCQAINGRF